MNMKMIAKIIGVCFILCTLSQTQASAKWVQNLNRATEELNITEISLDQDNLSNADYETLWNNKESLVALQDELKELIQKNHNNSFAYNHVYFYHYTPKHLQTNKEKAQVAYAKEYFKKKRLAGSQESDN